MRQKIIGQSWFFLLKSVARWRALKVALYLLKKSASLGTILRSSYRGPGRVTIESLQLDGALEIVTKSREECITIRNCVVKNAGKRVVRVPHSDDEVIAMRGFFIETIEVNVVTAEA